MSAAEFFGDWERAGTSVGLVTLSGRPFVEVGVCPGSTICLGLADAADMAQALDRVVTAYAEAETQRRRP